MMDKDEFYFNQTEKMRERSKLPFQFQQSTSNEKHHIVGKINSNITVPLCKACHDFITSGQNALSRELRKIALIFALESLASLLELCVQQIRTIIWRLINDKDFSKSVSAKKKRKEKTC